MDSAAPETADRMWTSLAQLSSNPEEGVFAAATEAWEAVVTLAREVAVDGTLDAVGAEGGSAADAFRTLWPRLPRSAPTAPSD